MKYIYSWLVCLAISVGTLYGAEAQAVTYTVSGSITGLASGKTVVLTNNTSTVLVSSTSTGFTFPAQNAGTNWNVSVAIQPSGQVCTVTNGSGTNISANITNVAVSCAATYTVGGTVTGLTNGALVLRMGNITLLVNGGASTFKFASGLKSGVAYNVLAAIQPPGFSCSVENSFGTISSVNVANVAVKCVRTYTVSGTVAGLTASGLTLRLTYTPIGASPISINKVVNVGAASFAFSNGLKDYSDYRVEVIAQPSSQMCLVTNAGGKVATQNVNDVIVLCELNTYTIGGKVSGTSGKVRLKLENITNGTSALLDVAGNSGYAATPLGSLGGNTSTDAVAVNDLGQVTGGSGIGSGYHAYIYSDGLMSDLGTLGSHTGLKSYGVDINDLGHAVGFSELDNGDIHAFVYKDGLMRDLGVLPGKVESLALGINNLGDIVGRSGEKSTGPILEDDYSYSGHAFLYTRGMMIDLGDLGGGSSAASAINNNGQIVGKSKVSNGDTHAFIYSNGKMTDIGTLGGAYSDAISINDAGQVTGSSTTSDGRWHAYLYSNGVMQDLGDVGDGNANGIDGVGQVYGNYRNCSSSSYSASGCTRYAYVYTNGMFVDLNDRVSGYALEEAILASENGYVAANSHLGTNYWHGFLLKPQGSFTFDAQSAGSQWRVTVAESPIGQTCTVSNGEGVALGSNVSSVSVQCSMATVNIAQAINDGMYGIYKIYDVDRIDVDGFSHYWFNVYNSSMSDWTRSVFTDFELVGGQWVASYENSVANKTPITSLSNNCLSVQMSPNGVHATACFVPIDLSGKSLQSYGFTCELNGKILNGCNAGALFPKGSMGYISQGYMEKDTFKLSVPENGWPIATDMSSYITSRMRPCSFPGEDIQGVISTYNESTKNGTIKWYEQATGCGVEVAASEFSIKNIGGIEIFVATYPPNTYKYFGFNYAQIAAYAPPGLNTGSLGGIYQGDQSDHTKAFNYYIDDGAGYMNSTAFNFIRNNYQLPPLP